MSTTLRQALATVACASLPLALVACSSSSASSTKTTLVPGDLVSETAAQHAIPHGMVLESTIGYSLQGQAGATLAGFCGATFASEAHRKQREQVAFTIPVPGVPGGSATAASNEVVRYSPGWATKAYDELKSAVRSCPGTYQASGASYTQNQSIAAPAGSAPETIADVQFIAQQPHTSVQVWEVNVFQFEGDYLSAIYAFDPTEATAMSEATSLATAARGELAKLNG